MGQCNGLITSEVYQGLKLRLMTVVSAPLVLCEGSQVKNFRLFTIPRQSSATFTLVVLSSASVQGFWGDPQPPGYLWWLMTPLYTTFLRFVSWMKWLPRLFCPPDELSSVKISFAQLLDNCVYLHVWHPREIFNFIGRMGVRPRPENTSGNHLRICFIVLVALSRLDRRVHCAKKFLSTNCGGPRICGRPPVALFQTTRFFFSFHSFNSFVFGIPERNTQPRKSKKRVI